MFSNSYDLNILCLTIKLYIYSRWCGPCKMLLPRIEKVIEEHNDKINLVKVDIDDNAEIAMEYGVSL